MPKKKILLGEDDATISGALSEYLQSLDYDVTWAASCESIKEAFRSSYPDAAILDYSLPDGT
ncbi:MAG TPA: hypothetical protein VMH85_06630, partial [Terriglobales bacterium]|nr:hypothetical protein [Terriglobales bacterium]